MNRTENINAMINMVHSALMNLREDNVKHMREHMSDYHYRQEFGLVKFHLPRQAGRTSVGIRLLQDCHGSLLIVKSGKEKNHIRHMLKDEAVVYAMTLEQFDAIMARVIIATDRQAIDRVLYEERNRKQVVVIERSDKFTFLEKEGIMSIFSDAKIIVEL